MIQYEYFEEGELIIFKYRGAIDKPTLISFIEYIYKETDATNLKKILSDFRDATIAFEEDDLKDIAHARAFYSKGFPATRTTYLVGGPRDTVITTLVSDQYFNEITNVNVFSTIEFCIRSLDLQITDKELSDRINNLKHTYKIN
ncbi:MAG TPA: hypothetical protein VIH57_23505 [Bacteroidales bacterium]